MGEEAIRRTRPRSARGARRGGHAGGPAAEVSPGEVEWSSGRQLLGRAGGPRYAARLPRRLRRLTGADERGVRKVEPIGRSSRTRTGRRISGGRSDTEVGQCSLGGAYGQKKCSGISGSRHREQ